MNAIASENPTLERPKLAAGGVKRRGAGFRCRPPIGREDCQSASTLVPLDRERVGFVLAQLRKSRTQARAIELARKRRSVLENAGAEPNLVSPRAGICLGAHSIGRDVFADYGLRASPVRSHGAAEEFRRGVGRCARLGAPPWPSGWKRRDLFVPL